MRIIAFSKGRISQTLKTVGLKKFHLISGSKRISGIDYQNPYGRNNRQVISYMGVGHGGDTRYRIPEISTG